jgi:hypothetical protein
MMNDASQGHSEVKIGSERSFGLVFGLVFIVVGLWPLKDGEALRLWAIGVAAVFVLAALLLPVVLKPLNHLWFRFGLLLHKVMLPLIMGLLFLTTILPIGLMLRAAKKDSLRLRRVHAASYWIDRTPPGPTGETLKNQF